MKKAFLFLIFLLSFWLSKVCTQEADKIYYNLTEKEGLPSNRVLVMAKDSIGFLWFGTSLGLVRFDGIETEKFDRHPDISDHILTDEIRQLETDTTGRIIALTKAGYILIYDYNSKSKNPLELLHYTFNEKNNDKFGRFFTGENDQLWVISNLGFLIEFDTKNKKVVQTSQQFRFLENPAWTYKEGNTCWIGVENGLVHFNIKKKILEHIPLQTDKLGLPARVSIGFIVPFGPDSLLMGCKKNARYMFDGLLVYNKKTKKTGTYEINNGEFCSSESWFDHISYLSKDEYYLKGEGNNAAYFNRKNKLVKKIDIRKGIIGKIHTVSLAGAYKYDEIIYIVSNQGIYYHDPKTSLFKEYYPYKIARPRGISGSWMDFNTGTLIIAGYRSVMLYDIKNDTTQIKLLYPCIKSHHFNDSEPNIFPINKDSFLIIGSQLFLLDLGKKNISLLQDLENEVCVKYSLFPFKEHKDKVYFANDGYLYEFSIKNLRAVKLPLKDLHGKNICLRMTGLAIDNNDILWITTRDSGLWRINKNSLCEQYKFKEKREAIPFSDILIDNNNIFWLTSPKYGLLKCYYQKNSNHFTFQKFQIKEGFKTSMLNQVIEDNYDNLWITTDYGISKFDKNLNVIQNYGKNHGVNFPHNLFRGKLKDTQGNIYFSGGINILQFDPDKFYFNENQVIIKKFNIHNGEELLIYKDTTLTLQPDQNTIRIEFASTSLSFPENNAYRYKLSGTNDHWNYVNAKQRNVIFSNLRPDKYHLIVQAANSEGVWGKKILKISFTLLPPWYKTWWFYLIILVILVYFVYFLMKINTRVKLSQQKAELEKQFAIENERSRIARDMHDDLGSGLSAIILLSNFLKNEKLNENSYKQIEKIASSSTELNQKLREIIWSMNPGQEYIQNLADFTSRYLTEADEIHSNIQIKFEISNELSERNLSKTVQKEIFLCVKEAVNNSIKHSEASNIVITMHESKYFLTFEIKDDGKGFDINAGRKKAGNGLANIEYRMASIQGSVAISIQKGTKVKLTIPLK